MGWVLKVNNYSTLRLLRKGLFAVNKVKDSTSVEVLERIKQVIYDEVKPRFRPDPLRIGHGGTLDSTATGVLAVGVGWGCKALPTLLSGAKDYRVVGKLGTATDTYNDSGQVVQEREYGHVTQETLSEALDQFKGKVMQVPPKYSALKLGGRRLSDLVQDGIEVNPTPRMVTCNEITLEAFDPPLFTLVVSCGGGFYVRSLIHDLGLALDTCAHVTELQRLRHGPFTTNDMLHEEDWSVRNFLNAIVSTRQKHSQYFNM